MSKYKEYILSELEKIRNTKENVVAQLNALAGAEEAFTKMLEKIDGEETESDEHD